MNLAPAKEKFYQYVYDLQETITQEMQQLDPCIELKEDLWQRKDFAGLDGGGGRTRAFSGEIFENAGVNTSKVYGKVDPEFAAKIGGNDNEMWAAGISLILHPRNPRIPTVHANFRMIQAGDKSWFGGGADLTPFYPYTEDFTYFHQVWKEACGPYGTYGDWKKNCDEYFVNIHRDHEMRGIGGIFFDHYNSGEINQDMEMVCSVAAHFIRSYFPIVQKRVNETYTAEDVDFQLHRRGRYVEFNLLHDRGTHFGLKSNGRTDSILISLPARCKFTYRYRPQEGSPHQEMMQYYYPHDW